MSIESLRGVIEQLNEDQTEGQLLNAGLNEEIKVISKEIEKNTLDTAFATLETNTILDNLFETNQIAQMQAQENIREGGDQAATELQRQQSAMNASGGGGGGLGGLLGGMGGMLGGAGMGALGIGGGIALAGLGIDLATKGLDRVPGILRDLGDSFAYISDVAEDFDYANLTGFGVALAGIGTAAIPFALGGILANFTEDQFLVKFADQIKYASDMSLDLDNLESVKKGFHLMDEALGLGFIAKGILANFVGKGAFSDLSDQLEKMSTTYIDEENFDVILNSFKKLDEAMSLGFIGKSLLANFISSNALTDLSDQIQKISNTEIDQENLDGVLLAMKKLDEAMSLGFVAKGVLANFVGDNALSGLAEQLKTFEEINGANLEQAGSGIGKLGEGLNVLTGEGFTDAIGKAVGSFIQNIFGGPIDDILKFADKGEELNMAGNGLTAITRSIAELGGSDESTFTASLEAMGMFADMAEPIFEKIADAIEPIDDVNGDDILPAIAQILRLSNVGSSDTTNQQLIGAQSQNTQLNGQASSAPVVAPVVVNQANNANNATNVMPVRPSVKSNTGMDNASLIPAGA
jgi:hypothetical protein